MKREFCEDAFEAALEIVAATMEGEAEVSLDKEGASSVMEYFKGIYDGMYELMCEEDEGCCSCGNENEEDEKTSEEEVSDAENENSSDKEGNFVIVHGEEGYSFELKDANGDIIAASEPYATQQACIKGIESIKHSVQGEIEDTTAENFTKQSLPKFEIIKDEQNKYRSRLISANGTIIAVSEGYADKEKCVEGTQSMKKSVLEAEIL